METLLTLAHLIISSSGWGLNLTSRNIRFMAVLSSIFASFCTISRFTIIPVNRTLVEKYGTHEASFFQLINDKVNPNMKSSFRYLTLCIWLHGKFPLKLKKIYLGYWRSIMRFLRNYRQKRKNGLYIPYLVRGIPTYRSKARRRESFICFCQAVSTQRKILAI